MATTSSNLPVLSGESGLQRYLQDIRKFPMLQPDEEYTLAKNWRESGDRDAAHRLVTSHLRLWPRSPWAIAGTACRYQK